MTHEEAAEWLSKAQAIGHTPGCLCHHCPVARQAVQHRGGGPELSSDEPPEDPAPVMTSDEDATPVEPLRTNLVAQAKGEAVPVALSETACGHKLDRWRERMRILSRQRRRLGVHFEGIQRELERIDARINTCDETLEALK